MTVIYNCDADRLELLLPFIVLKCEVENQAINKIQIFRPFTCSITSLSAFQLVGILISIILMINMTERNDMMLYRWRSIFQLKYFNI